MMQGRWIKILAGGFFLALGAGEARACSVCAFAFADYALPPIGLWMWLAVTWYLANAAVVSFTGLRDSGRRGLLGAVIIVLLGFVAAAFLGPLMLLFFFGSAVAGSWFAWTATAESPRGLRMLKRVGKVYLVAVVCLAGFTGYRLATRTPGEFLCKWSVNGPGREMFRGLETNEPASLPEYRYIVQHGSRTVVGMAAERIGEIGDPVQDLPLLRAAAQRLSDERWLSAQMNSAVAQLEERSNAAPEKK